MAAPCLLAPELKVPTCELFREPSQNRINHPCSVTDFSQNPAFTLPVSKILISEAQECFKSPNFRDSLRVNSLCASGRGFCCASAICQLIQGKWLHNHAAVQSLWQNIAERQHPSSVPLAGAPTPMLLSSAARWPHPFL